MKISFLLRAIVLSVCLLIWASTNLLAADMSRLIDKDCTRCHKKILSKLNDSGGKHSTEIACQDCHQTHPKQRGAEFEVSDCSTCHDPDDNKHFTIGQCKECHHAHSPLMVDLDKFDKPLKQICLSCHDNPYGKGSKAHQDGLRCTQCHTGHKEIPRCLDCHEGHTDGSVAEPCLSCHAAHNPLPPLEAEGLTAKLCTACHAKTTKAMAKSDAAHAQMSCDECHVQHKDQPDCMGCHEGHTPEMVRADCATCHGYHAPMPPVFTGKVNSNYCTDCHEDVSATFTNSGGAHSENLACADCHKNHPPADVQIAECNSCHAKEDNSHFTLEGCQQCHNPHSPQTENLDLSGLETARPFCASCHEDVIDVMTAQPTAHSDALDCNQCHAIHGQSPSCLDCHEGHTAEMQAADCAKCHSHHTPSPVEFADGTFSDYCVSCHEQAFTDLETGGRAHRELGCVDCHQAHPPAENAIPECSSCHDADDNPHFASPNCSACHNPHQPLKDDISGFQGSRQVCSGCHQDVEQELTSEHPSAHDRDCVACHRTHIGVPSCLGCHEGHDEKMTNSDCLLCHDAHKPLLINLEKEPPSSQCSACHDDVSAEVAEKGSAHRDQIACSSCHQQHPDSACATCHTDHPQQGIGIPDSCFMCHNPSDHPHYTVGDCLSCHSPHQPLVLKLQDYKPHAPVCVSCHEDVEQDFTAMPSAHSEQDCTSCHSEHTVTRICLDCHNGHEESMKQEDCMLCHSAHQPQDIQLHQDADIPQRFCAACHEDQAKTLDAKGAAHKQELGSCTACHPEHKPNGITVTESCNSCHSKARRRHFTLENCVSCHDPHQPLEMDLGKLGEVKPVCLSCHNNQERLHNQYPNKHTSFDCSKCHVGDHGSSKQCLDCHKPHIPEMTYGDCLKCHPPHLPHMIKARPTQSGPVCASCHADATGLLTEKGGKHSKQPCISCHRTHPPFGDDVIPSCTSCHEPEDDTHYTVGNCQQCHLAHHTLDRDLSKAENVKPACQSCHTDVQETFATTPSLHAEQDCNSCHPQHGQAMQCAECHEPHSPGMDYAACLSCHSAPHAPTTVAFNAPLPADHCSSCHSDQVDALAASKAAHSALNCVECHQGDHGSTQSCVDCHDYPHDDGLHKKFPDCLKCHNDPHDLADWRGKPVETAPAPEVIESTDNPAAPEAASNEVVQ